MAAVVLVAVTSAVVIAPAQAQRGGSRGGGGSRSGGGFSGGSRGGGNFGGGSPSRGNFGGGSSSRGSFGNPGGSSRGSFGSRNGASSRGSYGSRDGSSNRGGFDNRGNVPQSVNPGSRGGYSQRGDSRGNYAQRTAPSNRGSYNQRNYGGRSAYGVRPDGGNRGGYSSRNGYSNRGGSVYRGFRGRSSNGYYRPGYRNSPSRSFYYGRAFSRGGIRSYYSRPYIGFNHYYRGYYHNNYYPRIGFNLSVLPFGYYPFYYGSDLYYYSSGYYYRQYNNQYTVVEPPLGAEISQLPDGADRITIDGQDYYELNGIYYLPVQRSNGTIVYRIAGKDGELDTDQENRSMGSDNNADYDDDSAYYPQIGDVIDELPENSRKITINGEKMYEAPDGVHLREQTDSSGKKVYVVVSVPSQQ